MNIAKRTFYRTLGLAAAAAVLGLTVWTAVPSQADARVFVDIGVPFPGYYPYPYPYPYAYAPPPAYYYPPPAQAYYPPPAAPAAAPAAAPVAAAAPASISYTEKPAWRNAAGQSCREVRYANGGLGTACQDASGQWRIQ